MTKKYFIIPFLLIISLFIFSLIIYADSGLVYRLPVEGEINHGLSKILKRGVREAEKAGADLLIFEIDTGGGLVDAGIDIRDLILSTSIPTVCYVKGRAWSAGALIALAGEKMVMDPGSSIGAAETRPNEEKYISALRKEFKATAEVRGKNPQVAAAMVDADIEIQGLIDKGKLLTLTASEAIENKIADYKVDSLRDLYQKIDFQPAREIIVEPTSAEKMARFITNPYVSSFLLTIAFIAIIFEVLTVGFGVGGTVGLLSLGLFFSAYFITDLASWGLFLLFLVGLILIALEVFVVPGFGITGIGGLIAVFSSLYFLFPTPEIALSIIASVLIFSVLGTVIIIKYFGGSRFWKRISLGETQTKEAGYVAHKDKKELVGKTGIAITPLRPAGIMDAGGHRLDVVSEGGFIDKGEKIVITRIEGNRIVVRENLKEE